MLYASERHDHACGRCAWLREGCKQGKLALAQNNCASHGYVVTCPALPGLVTEGDTLEDAQKMAQDAIHAYLESLQKDGHPIPSDKAIRNEPVKEQVTVVLPTG